MSTPQSIKTKVKTDWLRAFPELTAYSQNRLYKIAGPIILGIEIMASPYLGKDYRPYFSIYPLWRENVQLCMEHPFSYFEIPDDRNLQFNILYSEHEKHDGYKTNFEEVVKCIREKIQIPFERDVLLKNIFVVIDENLNPHMIPAVINTYLLKLHLLLYFDNNEEIDKILMEIEQKRHILDCHSFKYFYGNFDIWYQQLKESLSHRDEFLQQIEVNKQDKKLKKMVVSEITV